MMKWVVLLCLVAVISAAEIEFFRKRNSNNNAAAAAGKPIQVPVVPQRNFNQKRQVDFNAGSRSSSGSRQSAGGVPLQQAFRPPPASASFNRPRPEQSGERPERNPERLEPNALGGQRGSGAPSSFAPPSSSEQLFAPLNEGPARAQPQQRPRPAAPSSFGSSAERPNRNPEYAGGFPSGFTSGLPSFDFQGRMPEPDSKSDGFMDGVLNNFPNLKSLGGFDAFPSLPAGREEVEPNSHESPVKRQHQQSRPVRPNSSQGPQKRRTTRAVTDNITETARTPKRLRKNRPIVVDDDEAMLEPDIPSGNRRSSRQPTDIADIIADSIVGAEQRYNPVFHPNSGPYGRFPAPPSNPVPSGRSRRPSSIGSSSGNRDLQRSPFGNQFEFVDDNSLLGSGNFDVLGGGVFRETGEFRPYNNNNNNNNAPYYPPAPPTQDTFRPNQQFYPLGQPPSQQLGNFAPQQPPIQQQPPTNNNNYNVPSYPTSFFDDDFFSNFRDFADVNQDYRN